MAAVVEIEGARRKLAAAREQAPFALALALTNLAKDAQAAVEATIPSRFDRPTPFTRRAVGIVAASKHVPVAQVFVRDVQAGYLEIQERGGVREPAPGAPVILPVAIGLDPYGNIPRGRVKREKAKPETFVVTGEDARARHLAPGIYRRFKRPKGRRAGAKREARPPKLLVAFARRARYRPRFGFVETVLEAVRARAEARLREAIARALATARRSR